MKGYDTWKTRVPEDEPELPEGYDSYKEWERDLLDQQSEDKYEGAK